MPEFYGLVRSRHCWGSIEQLCGGGALAPLIDPWTFSVSPVRGYDLFPDGSFVIALPDDDRSPWEQFGATEFHVILNFFEELKERVPNWSPRSPSLRVFVEGVVIVGR